MPGRGVWATGVSGLRVVWQVCKQSNPRGPSLLGARGSGGYAGGGAPRGWVYLTKYQSSG
jgi:hypothetical protein